MRPDKAANILKDTILALDRALGEFGFVRDPNARQSYYDGYQENWLRHAEWRKDTIGMSYPLTFSPIMYPGQIVMHADVYLPCTPGAPDELLDGRSVHYLARRRRRYELPTSWVYTLAPNRFKKVVVRDCIKALPWFDTFATPAIALEKLTGGQTNWGDTKGVPVKLITKYLTGLMEEGDRPISDAD